MIDNLYSTEFVGAVPTIAPMATYKAVESSNRRKSPKLRTSSEDHHLDRKKRRKMSATTRDAIRNFALAGWVVRKHLDYVTKFTFRSMCRDEGLNREIQDRVKEKSKARNCHASRRHPLRRIMRMGEARRVIDGDIALVKIGGGGNRGMLDTLEGDRIVDKNEARKLFPGNWVNGVRVNANGVATHYAVCDREKNQLRHGRVISARNTYLHAYWDSTLRFDQVRGVSPISSALNDLRDLAEGVDLTKALMKVHQMFGLKVTQTHLDGMPEDDAGDDDEGEGESEESSTSDKLVDLSGGPFELDLSEVPGMDAEFLTSNHPSPNLIQFLRLIIEIALKSIDCPYSFFDESHTNFFGSRGALMHYLRSCSNKIADNLDLLNWITRWWLGLWVFDGDLVLPRNMDFSDLCWKWVPDGVPWWDPSKEVRGNAMAIGAHLDNWERVTLATGTDVYENIAINAKVMKAAKDAGVPVLLPGVSPAADLIEALEDKPDE